MIPNNPMGKPPMNMGNNMGAGQPPQIPNDSNVMERLTTLISKYNDDTRLKVLFRLFESLNDIDERNFDKNESECIFLKQLHKFRDMFPKQPPLFKNIGYVAQKINRESLFFQQINQPSIPDIFKPVPESPPRIMILALHMGEEVISPIYNANLEQCVIIGKFFALTPSQSQTQIQQQMQQQKQNPINQNKPAQTKEAEIVNKDGNVHVNGIPIEPLEIDKEKIYIISKMPSLGKFSLRISINHSQQQQLSIFNWFVFQYVKLDLNYHARIKHPNCIVDIDSVFNRHITECPQCHRPFQLKDVVFEPGQMQPYNSQKTMNYKYPQMQQLSWQQQYQAQQQYQQQYQQKPQQIQQLQQLQQLQQQNHLPQPPPPNMMGQMPISQPQMQMQPNLNFQNQQIPQQMPYANQQVSYGMLQQVNFQSSNQNTPISSSSPYPMTPIPQYAQLPQPINIQQPQQPQIPIKKEEKPEVDINIWKDLLITVKGADLPPSVLDNDYEPYWERQYDENVDDTLNMADILI